MTESDKIKISMYKKIFFEKGMSCITIPEVSIVGNIADLMVINGDIHIYEIKSKNDSLRRLEKQINTFKKYANKVTVVADSKFIDKLTEIDWMHGVGIFSVDNGNIITKREAEHSEIYPSHYLAYYSTQELRETIRGFPNWYKMNFLEIEKKLINTLSPDEIRKLTLFRLKEKFGYEFAARFKLIKEKNFSEALNPRYEHLLNNHITPLKNIPYCVFKDFN